MSRRPYDDAPPLLRALLEGTSDEGYAAAARHRPGGAAGSRAGRARRPGSLLLVVPVLVAAGLLLATAAAQARAREASAPGTRQALLARIAERTQAADRRAADVDALRARLADGPGGAPDTGTVERPASLELAAGASAVEGPGVVVTLGDAPGAGRVLDRDLQALANDLWAEGAEAVAVGGQRLGAGTAIREAGEAILVGYRPIVPPYDVAAVGDPTRLEAALHDGAAGRELRLLAGRDGVRVGVRREERLRLPAASGSPLRAAVPLPAGEPGW